MAVKTPTESTTRSNGHSRPASKPRSFRQDPSYGRYAHVTGWGIEVPEKVMTNYDIEKLVDTSDEWIKTRTGIRKRHIAGDNESVVTLSVKAARKALSKADILPQDIDLIVLATSTPPYLFPSTASQVQDWLGATKAGAFDVLAACTGFIYALSMASAQIKAGYIDTALVIGAETFSRILDWTDRSTCILFGDAAGAFVLSASDVPGGIKHIALHSDGSGGDLLYASSGMRETWDGRTKDQQIRMNGREVFRFASKVMVESIKEVVEDAGIKMDDVDVIVPHQANYRIIQSAARGLGLPIEKFCVNIEEYGNTSAASVPLAFAEAVEQGRMKPNDKVVMVAFGAGLTWGAALLEWDVKPTPKSNMREFFREGWYILARGRSLLRRFMRWVESILYRRERIRETPYPHSASLHKGKPSQNGASPNGNSNHTNGTGSQNGSNI